MYSRNGGLRPPATVRGGRPTASVYGGGRMPSYQRSGRVEVPPGYSGHAIVDGEERPLGGDTPEARGTVDELPREPTPEPRFDGLPRVSEAGMSLGRAPERRTVEAEAPEETAASGGAAMSDGAMAALPAARPGGGLFDPSHFPFGHGFGIEELLLLGLMLLLLHEVHDGDDRGDLDETVILLGALLLAG